MIHTLIHEYAHACSITYPAIENVRTAMGGHDVHWGILYSQIYSDFFDFGGSQESKIF